MRRIRLAIGVLAASALLSGCGLISLLYPSGMAYPPLDPNFSFDPSGSEPPLGTLRHGTATIKITSGEPRTVELTHLSGGDPSMLLEGFGAMITWRTGDWALRVFGSAGGSALGDGELTLIREDTDPPLQADGSNCTITYTSMTSQHVAGRAECKGLLWADSFGDPMDLPRPSTSASPTTRPAFDATITFDATP